MSLTLGDVVTILRHDAAGATSLRGVTVSSVVVDSRLAVPGSLFVALPGDRTDGHLFVADALERSACAVLVQQPVSDLPLVDLHSTAFPAPPFGLLVPDTLLALQELAAGWRELCTGLRVVGITGSVGKTTTKELVAAVLRQLFTVLQSQGNYNNEIGLPLTLLQLDGDVQWLVQEMGMYDLGEIARLAAIARPEIGVVTNVGPTHLERLGSIARIAQAKAELVQTLPAEGVAVLNGDDPRAKAMAGLTRARVWTYGLREGNDLWASDVVARGLEGLALRLNTGTGSISATLPLVGAHSVYAALAAASVGLLQGLGWEAIIAGLSDPSVQSRIKRVAGIRGATILDDTYNASPASVKAALDVLAQMPGRRVAVLAGMLELGSEQDAGHRAVGRQAAEVASVLVTIGELGGIVADEARRTGMPSDAIHAVDDKAQAGVVLREILREGDVVLVKGSRGFALETLVQEVAAGD